MIRLVLVTLAFVALTQTARLSSSSNGRIIGGEEARAGQFPYAVAIYKYTDDGQYFYGGVLISNQWILTSGQAVANGVRFQLLIGSNLLTGADANRISVLCNTSILHPEYDPRTLANDIGLISLPGPILFSDYIKPIFLPSTDLQEDAEVVAIGWGETDEMVPGPVNELHQVNVVTWTTSQCNTVYGGVISDDMVCVQGPYNEGICLGDSGSPLVRFVLNQYHAEVVGVAIFMSTNGCSTPEPSGYTKIYPYLSWIKTNAGI